jgi:hypothetical protein
MLTQNEKEFIECVKENPEKAARILELILALRETSLKTNPVPQQKAV